MRRTDNYASNQIRILLNELSSGSHSDKKKAINNFQTYVETYQPEVADENVDYLFTGCINGKLGTGLLYWGGVGSDNKNSNQLKRICGYVVRLLRWLVCHESDSERGNCFYRRYVQLQLVDLKLLNFPKHFVAKRKKKKRGDDEDENEDIFVLLAILMNEHRTPQGKISRLDLDDLLLGDEDAHYYYNQWVNSGAIQQIPNYLGGKNREEPIDRPAVWADVVFKCVPLQEGEEDSNELDEEPEVIPPIPDPLGISSVDLRSVQAFYSSGRLMKSQTGQLARRTTSAVMPIVGATATGARKTSFRGSTTFIPYKHEAEDSDDSEEEDSEYGDTELASSVAEPVVTEAVTSAAAEVDADGDGTEGRDNGNAGMLVKARSPSGQLTPGREKKLAASVVPSDKNFSTVLFLTLVHGSASFNQLRAGQDHLQQHLMLQSSRRENLVRLHFGLFVQCAEGLEFLKAYRKGVVKGNEMRNRRGSNYRRTSLTGAAAEDPNGRNRRQSALNPPLTVAGGTGVGTDKGLERLKRSQATLDAAKIEAQRTLAPILERMKHSRRIKSAEKVLKRMTAILEYPVRMRAALDRGDLAEVVAIYQRVQAVPTSSSSLRILHKIKEGAGVVVSELKKQCFTHMMSPSANYTSLLHYGKIWLDLEGEASYYELLRQCLIRQVLHFIDRLKEIRDKFCTDCADANDRGLEQNLLRRSPFLSAGAHAHGGERDAISALVRRHAEQSNQRKRQSVRGVTASGAGGSELGEYGLRGRSVSDNAVGSQWNDDDDADFQEDRDEFEVDRSDSEDDWLDDEADFEEEFLDGDMDDLAFLDDLSPSGGSAPPTGGRPKRRSLTFSDELLGSDKTTSESDSAAVAQAAGGARRNSRGGVNHSVLLCALVRQGCVEAMVDLLAKWFPCMFRLVSALSSLNVSSSAQGSAPAPMLKHFSHISTSTGSTGNVGGKTAAAATTSAGGGFTNLNRGAISPTRILGAALKIYAGYVKQVISGVEASFSTLNLPSELIAAFNEVDAFIAHAVHPVRTVSPIVISLTSSHKIENKSFDAVAGSILVNPLREPFHRDALQEVYELYNAMEFIIRKEAASLQAAAVTAGQAAAVSAVGAGNFHHTRVPFGGGIAAGKANHLNFLSPASPYYESMNTLQALSKEGEMALAQKIMDRLLELSAGLTAFDPSRLQTGGDALSLGAAMGRLAAGASNYSDTAGGNKMHRRGSVMLSSGSGAAGVDGPVSAAMAQLGWEGMEQNVTELAELIMRCLRSLRLKVKREEWVAVVVQEGIQKVFSSFVEGLRREAMRAADGHASARSRDSMLGAGMISGGGGTATGRRGRNSRSHMRSSIGNGLVLETLEEELRFGQTDQQRTKLQLDILRACVRLRCNCIPFIGEEIRRVFALSEEDEARRPAALDAGGRLPFPSQDAAKKKVGHDAAGPTGLLSRTKSSLMSKLFAPTEKDTDAPTAQVPSAPMGSESPARIGSKEKKKLALLNILLMAVKMINVELFEPNLREVITIEDQAASTYVNIKTKEIRTTVFAGYALLVHNERESSWHALTGGVGALVRIPVHLARVLLSLGNERRVLAEALGGLMVLRGDGEDIKAEEVEEVLSPPQNGAAATAQASVGRSVFGAVEDSGSDSDGGPAEDSRTALKQAFCERLQYKDHLYKQLCVSLLNVYADLIQRLRGNHFAHHTHSDPTADTGAHALPTRRDNVFGTAPLDVAEYSSSDSDSEADGAFTKTPFCLGQAIEEHKYLKELFLPLLSGDPSVTYLEPGAGLDKAELQTQQTTLQRYCGKMFASQEQLSACGRMFSVMINSSSTDAE